jgi:hypothetical protein
MLAIDGGKSDFVLVMPRRHGGVVGMVLALEDAGSSPASVRRGDTA